ncbi:MAG: phospho-sugar mutase, partial [Bacilli bacterium]
GVIFSTIVSSNLAQVIAKSYGVASMLKLTGFKFIGDSIATYEKNQEKQFLFGFEESYGSLVNSDIARDKDAVQAIVILSEMIAYYKEQGQSLLDILELIYVKYGYYTEDLINISLTGIEGAKKITKLINDVKSKPFTKINDFKVVCFEDYTTSTSYQGNSTTPLTLPKADVLKFILDDQSWFCLRPSGTEPKLKVYISVVGLSHKTAQKKRTDLKKAINEQLNRLLES